MHKYCLTGILFLACTLFFQTFIKAQENEGKSAYLSKVLVYEPAPGQFIDAAAFCQEGEDEADLDAQKVCNFLTAKMKANAGAYIVSLGAFGGTIVLGFDHSIKNTPQEYDFRIYGNAFYDPAYGPGSGNKLGGNAEPGIVMVSRDDNGDGLPNDKWYELSGSETNNVKTINNYKITYYKPDSIHKPVFWKDNFRDSGYIIRNDFHSQNYYYPMWLEKDSLEFVGRRLPDNAENIGEGNVERWMLYAYDYGYADTHPNSADGSKFKIEWAVDENGERVNLPEIDFVKIYTAVRQNVGWVGEISTEFAGIEDLGLSLKGEEVRETLIPATVYPNPFKACFYVEANDNLRLRLYDMGGRLHLEHIVGGNGVGNERIDTEALKEGIYILEGKTERGIWYKKMIKL